VDLYISRTSTARDFAVNKGIVSDRAIVRGHMMRPRSHLEVLTPDERAKYRVEKLGLRAELFTVFLATGGNGANNHLALLPALLRHAERCQVIVVCGRNKDIFHELLHWRAEHPELNIYIEGYSENMHLLMQCSDVIVTRGGTTTCAKALHFRCPIIFNAFGGIMPQESLTWKFFRNGARTEKVENSADFVRIIDEWMADVASYNVYRKLFLGLRYEEDPTSVIDELVRLACEVNGAVPPRRPFPPI
jgi:processive 1,2-diacylglycerol beta-glucosyltransferase